MVASGWAFCFCGTANRLTSVISGATTTQFAYNGDGDRLAQIVAGVTTNYALDPAGLAQVLIETTSGQSTHYLPGLAQYRGTTWNYYLPDRLGSVRQMVDPSAAVLLAQSYDPFGNVLQQTGSGQSTFGYTGEQTDPTGLVFLRARYYNPVVGRFITADSIIPDPLSSGGWNRYVYAYNNPIRYTDPSGHCIGILLGVDTIICAEVVVAGAAFMAAGVYVVTSPEFQNALHGVINSSSLSMLPGYGMLSPGTYSQPVTPPHDLGPQCLDAGYWPTGTSYNLSHNETFPLLGPEMPVGTSFPTTSIDIPNTLTSSEGPYSVYVVKDPVTKDVIYVGISRQNLSARQSQHRSEPGRGGWILQPIKRNLSRQAARYWEQKLIDQNGGIDNLENKIRAVAKNKWSQIKAMFE